MLFKKDLRLKARPFLKVAKRVQLTQEGLRDRFSAIHQTTPRIMDQEEPLPLPDMGERSVRSAHIVAVLPGILAKMPLKATDTRRCTRL